MTDRLNIGYVLVGQSMNGRLMHSFRIFKSDGLGGKEVITGMDCPMWFKTRAGATCAADALILKVMEMLRQRGLKVEKHTV